MFSLTKRKLRGDMIAVFQDLKGCHREEGIGSFSIAPESRARTNGWKLIRWRSNLEIRRNFLTVRIIKQWNSSPPDGVGAPWLEAFKKRWDSHLSRMVRGLLSWAGGWTRRPPRSLPTLRRFCGSEVCDLFMLSSLK